MGNEIESIEYTKESISLYEILSESNPKAFLPYLFSTLSNLATIYYHFNLKDSLENLYSRIIDLSTQLKDKHPAFDKALYANNMNGLGLVYFNRKKYDSALSSYEEALSIFRDLSKTSPKTYEPNFAQIKRNIGNLYLDKKEFDKSLSFYEDALKIYQKYAKKNPEVYLPNVARTLHNIAVSFYLGKKEGYKAENYFHQAIKIKQGLVKKFPGIYESELVETIDNLAGLYISFNKFEEAKKYTNMSNAIRSKVMNLNEEKKAITWIKKNNEALKLSLQKNMYKYASKLGELNIARILSISSSTLDDYLKASSNNYSMLGYAYLKQSKIELAETNFETAKNLVPNNIKLHFYLSCLYTVKKDTNKAIIHFQKSIDLGFDDYESIKKESFLESFQNEEFYKEILRKIDK
ncbi:MAG: tetratricopeptide repeat protein [Ignavibacteriae bacterium]|nr:tetratricopeptide repeat protein [Ignavibacteriota bacterium]